jgi:hypothetical protein
MEIAYYMRHAAMPAFVPASAARVVSIRVFCDVRVGRAYPQVTIGAWGRIEQSKGGFNFQSFDKYMSDAHQAGLVDPATKTATWR